MKNYREKLKNIKAFVFDYDGVLTNGNVYLTDSGMQLRQGNVRDGYALKMEKKKGFHIAVITGSHDKGIEQRCNFLNIEQVYLGVSDKKSVFEEYLKTYKLQPEEVLFMGDDIPDYPIMKMAGIPCCPADACEEIKQASEYISPIAGGKGCVRDVIEQVLKINSMWFDHDAFKW